MNEINRNVQHARAFVGSTVVVKITNHYTNALQH